MSKRAILAVALGAGAVLVCRSVSAQPTPIGDPTVENLLVCEHHLRPWNPVPTEGDGRLLGLGWIENNAEPGFPPRYQSWAVQLPQWTPDRRPVMMVQLSSSGWPENPNGNAGWWWMADYGPMNVPHPEIYGDEPKDTGGPNLDYTQNRDLDTTPNGVPDQFDVLIRHFDRWAQFGVRRFIMHLPAGVYGGRLEGYGVTRDPNPPYGEIRHDGDENYAIYGGTNQSMNQFRAMPVWKRDYFLGINPPGYTAPNAWTAFLAAHSPSNYNFQSDSDYFDKYSVEVYVGGGININYQDLGTQFIASWGAGQPPVGSRYQSFNGLNAAGFRTYKPVWRKWYGSEAVPVPIDPRYSQQVNLEKVWYQLMPWIDQCGVKTIWLDAASENISASSRRWGSVELAHNPVLRTKRARIGGETFPTLDLPNPNGPGTIEVLDDCSVGNMPWFGNYQVASRPEASSPNGRTWKDWVPQSLQRSSSEMHMLDGDGSQMGWNEWKQARMKGFVVGAYNGYNNYQVEADGSYTEIIHAQQAELLKRWYSLGRIRICDFNGDGKVGSADFNLAIATIDFGIAEGQAGRPVWPAVFGTGDVNNDGQITIADENAFLLYWMNTDPNHLQTTVVDYSAPGFRNLQRDRF